MSESEHSHNVPNYASASPPRMGRAQKIITTSLWMVLLLVVVGVLVGKFAFRATHEPMHVLFEAARFSLTDQNGKPLSSNDLRGKAYICDFIFTTCGSACPIMTHKLADVQNHTPAEVQLVSFTVNPEHDTPAVLKEYATANGADQSRWHFLTGTREQMSQAAVQMKIQRPDEPNPTVNHSEKFFLVDGDGNVRGIYNSDDAEEMQALPKDAAWLSKTRGAEGR